MRYWPDTFNIELKLYRNLNNLITIANYLTNNIGSSLLKDPNQIIG